MDAQPGAAITEGHPLLMLESMKIEMMLPAPVDGRIAEICVNVDEFVGQGCVLVVSDV